MPDETGYFDYTPLVAPKVQEDTFPTLGIGEGPSEINMPLLDQIDSYWSASPEEREGMEPPSFEGIFAPGMEKLLIGTIGEASYRHGDKPGWGQYVEDTKMQVAKAYPDPMHKNRVALLHVQSSAGGQDRLLAERLQGGGGGPETATPPQQPIQAPQPVQEPVDPESGLTRREIMELLEADAISKEQASEMLGRLAVPTPQQ